MDMIPSTPTSHIPDRSHFTVEDSIAYLWRHSLGLPTWAIGVAECDKAANDKEDEPGKAGVREDEEQEQHLLPSSFRLTHLAQVSTSLSALAAALVSFHDQHGPNHNRDHDPDQRCQKSGHGKIDLRTKVHVQPKHAVLSFASERLYSLDGTAASDASVGRSAVGGLFRCRDGWVRIHDGFARHREAVVRILGLDGEVERGDVERAIGEWKAKDLETAALEGGAVVFALRGFEEWDCMEQGRGLRDSPVEVRKIGEGSRLERELGGKEKCLQGLRVLELSRVIAAPVAGRTLAAHGADVLWVTSPNLEAQPALDIDTQRGKRRVRLDLNREEDRDKFKELIKDADVFLQSYRPSSLAARGFSPEALISLRPGLIVANLSAWGTSGPWKTTRGFDSMVQTVSGMNVSEAEHFGADAPAKPTPVQALDHAAGYLLAAGIAAAVYRREREGGSWQVNVSLAGVGRFLRSLGQVPGRQGFDGDGVKMPEEWARDAGDLFENRETGFGRLRAVRHPARIDGREVGWEVMPREASSAEGRWL